MRTGYLIAALALASGSMHAKDMEELIDALADMPGYAATVTYAITLPQAEDDIVYTIDLRQPADPDSYLIDWSVEAPSGIVEGFTAWFDGHFYNFRNRRLQEEHYEARGQGAKAPQNSAQFASLLPSRLAMQLREIASGPYTFTLSENGGTLKIEAVRHSAGEPDAELLWTFDAATFRPLGFAADYNPGAITGQQVNAVYSDAADPLIAAGDTLSEAALRRLYPDAFTRYRESMFAIENMRGEYLPAFSLPTAAGTGRLSRMTGDPLRQLTAVVLFNPENALSPGLISAVRNAVMRLPVCADVIWACTLKDPEAATGIVGPARDGETTLTGASALAAECGAAALPVVLICDCNGRVSDLVIGMTGTLEADLVQLFAKVEPRTLERLKVRG